MRLTEADVKHAILHPDQDVREAAVYYFARSCSQDEDVMTLALKAVEQHGREAFGSYSFIENLPQSDHSIRWLIRQIEALPEPTTDEDSRYRDALLAGLAHADPALLERHKAEIESMTNLDAVTREAIDEQIFLSTFGADALWRELEDFCQATEEEGSVSDEDHGFAGRIVTALSRHGERFADQVLAILAAKTGRYGKWMEGLCVRLAGQIKLDAAVPYLIEKLTEDDDWLHEECHWALISIGTESVVTGLADAYPQGDWYQSVSVASILEDIHSDLSVQTCLELLADETDPELRGHLLQSILMNFSTDGVELARRHVLTNALDPELLEVRSDLLTACKMMGVTFPEFDAWHEDSQNDGEFRRKWYVEHHMALADELDDEYEEDWDEEAEEDSELEADLPATTLIHRDKHVGRNDPCPCGSGKKFKNCCLDGPPTFLLN